MCISAFSYVDDYVFGYKCIFLRIFGGYTLYALVKKCEPIAKSYRVRNAFLRKI